MTNSLLIYLCQQDQTQSTEAAYNFDTTIIGDLVDADVGYAITTEGTPVQFVGKDRREEVHDRPYYVQSNTLYNSHFCADSPDQFSREVELFSGERVAVDDYEVILISHFWLHHHYLRYLQRNFPEQTYIGIQEESVQDIIGSASRLQAAHFETLTRLDGAIAFNEQYRRWIEPHCDEVLRMPLPVPPDHFDGIIGGKRQLRDAACVGIGTWNVDHGNFYTNVRVLEKVRDNGHDISGEIIGILDRQRGVVDGLQEEFDFLRVYDYMSGGFYDHLASLQFAVLMTTRATAGRVAAECAGLGVPCVGNENNDMQVRCWPELAVDPHDVPGAIARVNRLLEDDTFYASTVQTAQRRLSGLQDVDRFERRLRLFLSDVRD